MFIVIYTFNTKHVLHDLYIYVVVYFSIGLKY